MKQKLKTCSRIILLSTAALLYAAQAFAVRPFLADDAETVRPFEGVVEFKGTYNSDEANSKYIVVEQFGDVRRLKKEQSSNEFEMKAVTGLYEHIDLSVIASGIVDERVKVDGFQTDKRDAWNDLIVEMKYNFFEHAGYLLTVKPTFQIPIGTYSKGASDGRWGFGGTLIASKTFAEKYTLLANASYFRHDYRTDAQNDALRKDIWSGSIAAEAAVLDGWKFVTDFSLSTNQDRDSSEVVSYALVGYEYEVSRHLSVFAAGKFGLTEPSTDVAALYGISLKF